MKGICYVNTDFSNMWQGSAISILPEDCYRQKLWEVKTVCSKWKSLARKVCEMLICCVPDLVFLDFIIFCFPQVSADCGALELEKVFELILEGENLPAYLERETKVSAIPDNPFLIF